MSDTDAGAADVTPLSANGVVDIDSSGDSIADVMALYSKSDPIQVDDGESDGAENADDAEAVEKALSENDNVESPDDEETATTEDEKDEPEVPAIDPPKSWSKEQREKFWGKLDPDLQQMLYGQDSEAEKAIKRSFNEAAETRNAAKAEQDKAEQARQQYEAYLPQLLQMLEGSNYSDLHPDIKSNDDYFRARERAAAVRLTDPFEAGNLQAQADAFMANLQRKQFVQAQMEEADKRKAAKAATEAQARRADYDKRFIESLSDPDKEVVAKYTKEAPQFLQDKGLTPEELNDFAATGWVFHPAMQSLVLDGMKYRDLQKAPPKAIPKPVPPVQKPGTTLPNAARTNNIQNLERNFERTGSVEDAFALQQARDRRRAS